MGEISGAPHGTPERTVLDHLRAEDGEHVGYIEVVEGGFVPYDLLWVRRGEPMELDESEAALDAVGLRLRTEDWLLREDDGAGRVVWSPVRISEVRRESVVVAHVEPEHSGLVAKSVRLVDAIELPLPTDRLRPAD